MAELRKCSRCTSTMELKYFSINRKGEHYKCCQNCKNKRGDRNQKPEVKEYSMQYHNHKEQIVTHLKPFSKEMLNEKVECEICGSVINRCNLSRHKQTIKCTKSTNTNIQTQLISCVDYYVKLPIMKFEEKQDNDIRIDAIVVLNHIVEFEPTFKRYDKQVFTYRELTKLDSVEFDEGTDPITDYMPNEYVAPVLLKINGIMYRASCLTWFPLTNCCDAIKLKQYEENQEVYPIYVKKGHCPVVTITNDTGYQYHQRLPGIGHKC
jgi:hypothetical protein